MEGNEEVKGPVDSHEQDLTGRGTPDSIFARRIWQGPALLKLASGEEVKVHSGEWAVDINYNTFEDYIEEGVVKTREIFKKISVPMPDDAVRSLFGHLFPEEDVDVDSLPEASSNGEANSGSEGGIESPATNAAAPQELGNEGEKSELQKELDALGIQ